MENETSSRLFAYHLAAAHAVLRVTFGLALVAHGVTCWRVGGATFSGEIKTEFHDGGSFLPAVLVHGFAVAMPIVEMVLGGLLVVGFLNLFTQVLAGLLVAVLAFGVATLTGLPGMELVAVAGVVVFLLVAGQPYDQWSVDGLIRGIRNS